MVFGIENKMKHRGKQQNQNKHKKNLKGLGDFARPSSTTRSTDVYVTLEIGFEAATCWEFLRTCLENLKKLGFWL